MAVDFADFQAAPAAGPARPQNGATHHDSRQELPADLFSEPGPEAAEDGTDEWGEFAAPAPAQQQTATLSHNSDAISKGDLVWYRDRSGNWLEAQVVSVDHTIQPPSYGISLTGGSFRETEQHRLLPRVQGMQPPLAQQPEAGAPVPAAQQHVGAAQFAGVPTHHHVPAAAAAPPVVDDDFGDFEAAAAIPAASTVPAASAAPHITHHTHHAAHHAAHPPPIPPSVRPAALSTAPAAVAVRPASNASSKSTSPTRGPGSKSRHSSGPGSPVVKSLRSFLHAALPEVADRLDEEDSRAQQAQQAEEDFGDFAAAASGAPAVPVPVPVAVAAAVPAAAAAVTVAAAPTAAVPMGVQRDQPLSLDLFGEEQEEGSGDQQAAEVEEEEKRQVEGIAGAQQAAQAAQEEDGEADWEWGAAPAPQAAAELEPVAAQQHAAVAAVAAVAGAAAAEGAAGGPAAPFEAAVQGRSQQQGQQEQGASQAQAPAVAAVRAPPPPHRRRLPNPFLGYGGPKLAADPAHQFVKVPPGQQGQQGQQGQHERRARRHHNQHQQHHHHGHDGQDGNGQEQEQGAAVPPAAPVQLQLPLAGEPGQEMETVQAATAAAAARSEENDFDDFVAAAPEQPGAAAGQPAAALAAQPAKGGSGAETGPGSVDGKRTSASSGGGGGLVVEDTAEVLHVQQVSEAAAAAAMPAAGAGEGPIPPHLAAASSHQDVGVPAVRKQPAVLSALRPVSPRSTAAGGGGGNMLSSRGPAADAAAAAAGEVVTEYAVAWARLLHAAAQQLHTSAAVWVEAVASAGCWRELQVLPAMQQHLMACGQLYCAAAVVRLAAQELGLLSLVPELQEGWAQVQAAWNTLPPSPATQADGAEVQAALEGAAWGEEKQEEQQEEQQHLQSQGQLSFQQAVVAAAIAARAPSASDAEPAATAAVAAAMPILGMLESAPVQLSAMSLDDFPRLFTWSEGLCSLTLLPLSLFEGHMAAAEWVGGRPCLVPLANLWLHHVSPLPPQLD